MRRVPHAGDGSRGWVEGLRRRRVRGRTARGNHLLPCLRPARVRGLGAARPSRGRSRRAGPRRVLTSGCIGTFQPVAHQWTSRCAAGSHSAQTAPARDTALTLETEIAARALPAGVEPAHAVKDDGRPARRPGITNAFGPSGAGALLTFRPPYGSAVLPVAHNPNHAVVVGVRLQLRASRGRFAR